MPGCRSRPRDLCCRRALALQATSAGLKEQGIRGHDRLPSYCGASGQVIKAPPLTRPAVPVTKAASSDAR
jgi:hypothetical protein